MANARHTLFGPCALLLPWVLFSRRLFPMRRLLMAAACLLLAVATASAQLATGNITGTVQDEQGGVLPGVTITLQGTDRTASAVSDDGGQFRFLNLAPGMYKLTTSLQGFTTVVRESIEVRVAQNDDLPISLRVARVA